MSVVRLVILLVSAACVLVQELQEDVVAAALDIAGAQAMVEGAGATALKSDPPSAAVHHLVGAAIAGHHRTVHVKSFHMPMEMAQGIVAEAGVKSCSLVGIGFAWKILQLECVYYVWSSVPLCFKRATPSASWIWLSFFILITMFVIFV